MAPKRWAKHYGKLAEYEAAEREVHKPARAPPQPYRITAVRVRITTVSVRIVGVMVRVTAVRVRIAAVRVRIAAVRVRITEVRVPITAVRGGGEEGARTCLQHLPTRPPSPTGMRRRMRLRRLPAAHTDREGLLRLQPAKHGPALEHRRTHMPHTVVYTYI
jgi:hypothetical protein